MVVVCGTCVRRDDCRTKNDRLVPSDGYQPSLRLYVRRLSRILLLRNSPAVSVPGDGCPRASCRQSDARSHWSDGRVVRRQYGRHLRQLCAVRSLWRAQRRRTSTVRPGVRGMCGLCRVDCRSCLLRRQRAASTSHRKNQGSTTHFVTCQLSSNGYIT